MASERVQVPIKLLHNRRWGDLNAFGERHEFCAEDIKIKDAGFSFAGDHRARLCVAKKNVHWRIPDTAQVFDISEVSAANPPRRLPRR